MEKLKAKVTSVTFTDKKFEVKVTLPEDIDPKVVMSLFRKKGQNVLLDLQDPQMSLDDYDEELDALMEDVRRKNWLLQQHSKVATVDSQGIVQKLEGQDEGQSDLMEHLPIEGNGEQEESGEQAEDGNSDKPVQDPADPDLEQHERAQEPDTTGQKDDGNEDDALIRSIDNGDFRPAADPAAIVEPTKEDVELFIITEKPKFDDINFDPELLVEKKEKGLTWMEVANARGINSSDLQTDLGKYRKRVAELMKRGAA